MLLSAKPYVEHKIKELKEQVDKLTKIVKVLFEVI